MKSLVYKPFLSIFLVKKLNILGDVLSKKIIKSTKKINCIHQSKEIIFAALYFSLKFHEFELMLACKLPILIFSKIAKSKIYSFCIRLATYLLTVYI